MIARTARTAALMLLLLAGFAAGGAAPARAQVPSLPAERPLLTLGSQGDAVAALQRALAWLGHDPGPVDGRFGARTRAAVAAFQRRAGLPADGRVGPRTWRSLATALARSYTLHRVEPGETLWSIARRYGVTVESLIRHNRIADPQRLRAGSTLVVRRDEASPPRAGREGDRPTSPAATAPVLPPGTRSGPRAAETPAAARPGTATPLLSAPTGPAGGAPEAPPAQPARGGSPAGRPAAPVPVALTFNDGPDPAVTPALLDVLARHGVRATFFVVASLAERYPDLIRRMVQEGHEVESHGYLHRPLAGLPVGEIRDDLARASQAIARLAGRRPLYLRPPGGLADARVVEAAQAQGLRILLWTNVGAEHRPDIPRDEMVRRLVRAAHPGAVLMLHADVPGAPELVDALLTEFAQRRVFPLPLGELLRAAAR